jgi:hypothetical protein
LPGLHSGNRRWGSLGRQSRISALTGASCCYDQRYYEDPDYPCCGLHDAIPSGGKLLTDPDASAAGNRSFIPVKTLSQSPGYQDLVLKEFGRPGKIPGA